MLEVKLDDEGAGARGSRRTARRARERLAGVLEKYAKLVGPAHLGAVTHSGAVEWPEG